jgi:hypothetical protein
MSEYQAEHQASSLTLVGRANSIPMLFDLVG